jgi:hypothetical protein
VEIRTSARCRTACDYGMGDGGNYISAVLI